MAMPPMMIQMAAWALLVDCAVTRGALAAKLHWREQIGPRGRKGWGLVNLDLPLAALIAAGLVFSGPLFVRWQRRKDGTKQRFWRNAGGWEIVGLAIFVALALMAWGPD